MNGRNVKNNAFDNDSEKLKPVIKTIFLDTDRTANPKTAALGIAMLFFCILAGTVGVVLCFAASFKLEVGFFTVTAQAFAVLVVLTAIYLLPSKYFTALSFFAVAGLFGLYIYLNYQEIFNAVYYTFNLCLFKITEEGYIIGSIVDYALAKNPNPEAENFIGTSLFLLIAALACIFSYIVYSKKSMWIAMLVSLIVIFPGFFYGLIPGYTPFAILVAFWVSVFAINIFETGYIEDFINKSNRIPEKKLEKYKYKQFKKQYYKNVNSVKAEIVEIIKSPNREENSLRLDRLVRELQKISNNQDWFLKFYGLDRLYKPKKASAINSNTIVSRRNRGKADKLNGAEDGEKSKKAKAKAKVEKKDKFLSPVKLEKLRIKEEKKRDKREQAEEYAAHKKALRSKPIGERLKIYLGENFAFKIGRSGKSGYAGFAAFTIALAAIIIAQPLVSPKARFKASMPQTILETMAGAVEYMLVGSNSSAYGGYSGGMGGGFLLSPGGANFQYKPVLKIKPANAGMFNEGAIFPVQTFQSNVVYLRGGYSNIYDGKKWLDADKTHIESYDALKTNERTGFGEDSYFIDFNDAMQDIFNASNERINSEVRKDSIVIEHLGSRGTAAFVPYFSFYTSVFDNDLSMRKEADLHTSIERPLSALLKRPEYAVQFYSVDNVLNRADYAVEDLKQYLDFYQNSIDNTHMVLLERHELLSEVYDIYVGILEKWDAYKEEYVQKNLEDELIQGIYLDIPEEEIANNENLKNAYDELVNYDYGVYVDWYDRINAMLDTSHTVIYSNESQYYEFVMENYLDVPDTLPQEVIDLAEEITKGADSPFEKALAIEEYLAENHEYTLHPMMPEDPNKDFIYNFLFETKEGYCTYYATSMVIMMRSLGIPSRYTEGFLVDMRKRQRDIEGNQFITVYDSNAHAWPEVYLRGIGWVPFEPTASIIETPEETEPYVYVSPARIPGYDGMYESMSETEEILEEEITADDVFDYSRVYFALSVITIATVIIVALNIINYIVNSRRMNYFKTAKPKAAVIKMLAYTLKLLRWCGFVMYNDEGLREFADRVTSNLEIFAGLGFNRAAEIMQKARFSGGEMSEEERSYVYDFVTEVKKNAEKDLRLKLKMKFKYVYFIL